MKLEGPPANFLKSLLIKKNTIRPRMEYHFEIFPKKFWSPGHPNDFGKNLSYPPGLCIHEPILRLEFPILIPPRVSTSQLLVLPNNLHFSSSTSSTYVHCFKYVEGSGVHLYEPVNYFLWLVQPQPKKKCLSSCFLGDGSGGRGRSP
jgi:hypothetical protein